MTHPILTRRQLMGAAGAALATSNSAMAALPSIAPQPSIAPMPSMPRGHGQQNMILFFPDETRADTIGTWGDPVCKTPNMDLLAKEGARFQNCHVAYPVCTQSRCSLLSGWPTSARGHRSLFNLLQPDEPNMFRYLKQAGYDVFWFGKNSALNIACFDDSVTDWRNSPRYRKPLTGYDVNNRPLTMLEPPVDRRETVNYDYIGYAKEILARTQKDRPFCIFLPLPGPTHPPYSAPQEFLDLYDPAKLAPLVPPGLKRKPNFHADIRSSYRLDQASDMDLRKVRATYYAQTTYTDWLLGEIMEALSATGHDRDTALMVASDHGDYAGDYGLVEKWPSGLEDCLTHVPLLCRVPGGKPGVVSKEMVAHYDLMPTMLELGGTKARHTQFGISLVDKIMGGADDLNRLAFTEGGYNITEPQAFEPRYQGLYEKKTALQNDRPQDVTRCASARSQSHKLIWRPDGQSELYDCIGDPGMRNNIIDEHSSAKVQSELQLQILNWYIKTSGVPSSARDTDILPTRYPTAF